MVDELLGNKEQKKNKRKEETGSRPLTHRPWTILSPHTTRIDHKVNIFKSPTPQEEYYYFLIMKLHCGLEDYYYYLGSISQQTTLQALHHCRAGWKIYNQMVHGSCSLLPSYSFSFFQSVLHPL